VNLVTAESVTRAELVDPTLDSPLLFFQPGELGFALGQRTQELRHQGADGLAGLCSPDPGLAVDLVGYSDRDVLHRITIPQKL